VMLVFPLEWADWKSRRELRAAGVVEETWGADRAAVWSRTQGCEAGHKEQCRCVLFLHGTGDQPSTWKRVLTASSAGLPERFDWVAPALSDRSSPKSVAQSLLDQYSARCPQWTVVGNSRGAWVAVWMALLAPERILRLALFAPAGLKDSVDPQVRELLTNPTVAHLKEFQSRAYFKPREIPERVWKAISDRAFDSIAQQGAPNPEPSNEYLDGALAQVRVPTLVWAGKSDRVLSTGAAQRLRAAIPGAAMIETENCGHLPQKECPEQIARALESLAIYGSF
jgi:pimeloyl-ACP methyl ester carboxylesterase